MDRTDLDPDELTDDALTDRIRVWQRRRGHRYSCDDVVTARVAVGHGAAAGSYLDLGCGLGSVLLMVSDRLPGLRAVGLETQAVSFALAQRNVERNALSSRVRVLRGDLRDPAALERVRVAGSGTGFDLITGTPPYKPVGTATPSPDSQRAHARMELQGGVEDYLASAARLLAPSGVCVVCMESGAESRVRLGARHAGLRVHAILPVVPMAGRKGRLFSVFTLRVEGELERTETSLPAARVDAELVLRDADGARTPADRALRSFFGHDSASHEAPSPVLRVRTQAVTCPNAHQPAREART